MAPVRRDSPGKRRIPYKARAKSARNRGSHKDFLTLAFASGAASFVRDDALSAGAVPENFIGLIHISFTLVLRFRRHRTAKGSVPALRHVFSRLKRVTQGGLKAGFSYAFTRLG
jgi:hypothetical protein